MINGSSFKQVYIGLFQSFSSIQIIELLFITATPTWLIVALSEWIITGLSHPIDNLIYRTCHDLFLDLSYRVIQSMNSVNSLPGHLSGHDHVQCYQGIHSSAEHLPFQKYHIDVADAGHFCL